MEGPTPGSWSYEPSGESDSQFRIIGHEGEDAGPGQVLADVFFTVVGEDSRDGEANARLMSASPDLLEACRAMLIGLNGAAASGVLGSECLAAGELMEAAYEKATGKSLSADGKHYGYYED